STEAEFGDQDGSSFMKSAYNHGIFVGSTIAIGFCAIGRGNARGIEQVLGAPRNTVQWAAVLTGGDLGVCLSCLSQPQFTRKSDDAMKPGIVSGDTLQVNVR